VSDTSGDWPFPRSKNRLIRHQCGKYEAVLPMGRGRDFRGGGSGRGWRAHEEDHAALNQPTAYIPHSPSRRPPTDQGPTVEAIVKWFNPEKGFGFVEIADGSGDAFLSAKTLQMLGCSPGAKLNVFLGPGDKGRQVTKIAAVEDGGQSSALTHAATSPASRPRHVQADLAAAKEVLGKVKWFSVEKGMGFVAAEDGGADVFVHVSVVKKARMADLSEDQRIVMQVVETPKGRQAVSIATLG
jgi:cold shock protein